MNRSLVLLSGEGTSVPEAEAKALFLMYDPTSKFESPEERVLLVESNADPFLVSSRIAFARRVGILLGEVAEAQRMVAGKKVRFRRFSIDTRTKAVDPGSVLEGLDAEIDLIRPDYEITLVQGGRNYLALTRPREMIQQWSERRPRRRAFFHPSAIFPKLSRALVNLSRCKQGSLFLDPFAGTGSLTIEAAAIGAEMVAADQVAKMASGALANMKHFHQEWLGVVRADAFASPFREIDAIATDVPYGRASSTRGMAQESVVAQAVAVLPSLLRKGGHLVLMHSRQNAVTETRDLAVEEEHYLYVHKRLTRAITILRRR